MDTPEPRVAETERSSGNSSEFSGTVITKGVVNEPAPLSFVQERRWFLEQMKPNNPPNFARAIQIVGRLDVILLRQTLNKIVTRQEVLRTTFGELNGEKVQLVHEGRAVSLSVIDLTWWSQGEREAEVQFLLNEESLRPFDLAKDLVLRASLLLMAQNDQVLILTAHRSAFDNWSFRLFLHELATLYDSLSNGVNSELPSLPFQYSDFARRERSREKAKLFKQQVSYWERELKDVPSSEIPTDRARPAVQTFSGTRQVLKIADPLFLDLKNLCQRERITLYVCLLAGLAALLHFYTGLDDIVIGTSYDGRLPGMDELMGCFTSFLALRFEVNNKTIARNLLHQVQKVVTGGYVHRDVPFAKVIEELQPQRDLSRSPLFQVLFSMDELPLRTIKLSELTLIPLEIQSSTAEFDLTVSAQETDTELTLSWEYNTDLFDHSTISRMMNHYTRMLENVVAEPGKRLLDWNYWTPEERHRLLSEWNNTTTDYPKEKCIHQLFEEQVTRTPDATALIFNAECLTYHELNQRANQLAHYLKALGVGPETPVGVCVERSVEMIVGILGVLKAGGAYVPLDPAYPAERLDLMLDDSQATVLLTQQQLVARLNLSHQDKLRVICLDQEWNRISQEATSDPATQVSAGNLAYVIYTSGSTGRPKGVAMEHRPLINLLWWQLKTLQQVPEPRTLQFASLSFDVSFQEMFSTWQSGGTLVLCTEELRRDPVLLLQFLRDQAIQRLFLPFVALQQLAEVISDEAGLPSSLVEIVTAGEQLQITPKISLLFERSGCVFHNQYGPSESHVVTAFTLQGAPAEWPKLPPIGRPISNARIYLLDADLRPVPIGAMGELFIGGDCLARGYINRPDLTAERFISDPFSKEPQARMYRTGDLARYLGSGEIEYLGRIDNQVKIRGYRVELGEIEAAISQYPAVSESVVIAREDQPGDKRLVAYVALNQQPATALNKLRHYLEQKLPGYMVPSAFVELKHLPLTRNGKIDRRALPVPGRTELQWQAAFVAPRDEIEIKLAEIWERILGIKPVGARDNFFELGGTSLLAARIFSETNRVLGKNLPLAALFQGGTIEHLASLLRQDDQAESRPEWSSLVAIQPGGPKRPFFCVHGVGGNIISYRALARYLGSDQPFYGLQSAGLDGKQRPHTTIEAMAAHYLKVIASVQPKGPYFLGGLSLGGIVAFEMAHQLQRQGGEVGCIALLDTQTKLCSADYKLAQRLEMHFDTLRSLSISERLNYLRSLVKTGKRKLKSRIWRAGYKWYQDGQDQLPSAFLNIKEINYQAGRQYVLQPYPGRVALFRADDHSALEDDDLLGWDRFSTGVDVYNIPGDHVNIVNEPHVRVLAEQLKQCLNRATSRTEAIDTLSIESEPSRLIPEISTLHSAVS